MDSNEGWDQYVEIVCVTCTSSKVSAISFVKPLADTSTSKSSSRLQTSTNTLTHFGKLDLKKEIISIC